MKAGILELLVVSCEYYLYTKVLVSIYYVPFSIYTSYVTYVCRAALVHTRVGKGTRALS